MARFLYLRVSTSRQSFDQQMQDIKAYGVDPENVDDIVEEHESGGKSYTDRKFQQLLNRCKSGDTIFAASTDRLGRNFVDMIRMMNEAKERGITIVACKQNVRLDSDDVATKILLSITSIIDEDERKRIKHRIANKKAWQREQIAKQGYFTIENGPNAGEKCTYVGSPKGHDTSAAREAAAMSRQNSMIEWREQSKGYDWVRTQVAKGKPRSLIIEEFNELHKQNPENYCTREGKPLSKGILSKWIREMNQLTLSANLAGVL